MRKIIVAAYKYDEESKTVMDRYICSKCFELVKEEKREVEGKRIYKRSSFIYYIICPKCKGGK